MALHKLKATDVRSISDPLVLVNAQMKVDIAITRHPGKDVVQIGQAAAAFGMQGVEQNGDGAVVLHTLPNV